MSENDEDGNLIPFERFLEAQKDAAGKAKVIQFVSKKRKKDLNPNIVKALSQYSSMDNKHLKKRDENGTEGSPDQHDNATEHVVPIR